MSFELLFELILAILLGGLVGLEREFRGKPTGVRTTILICLGAVLFMRLSQSMALRGGDPGRLAAQIITGVGFLGGGAILRTKGTITGLTSAATIWAVTAIGMTIGVGAHGDAVGATSLVLLVLVCSDWLRRRFVPAGAAAVQASVQVHRPRMERRPTQHARICDAEPRAACGTVANARGAPCRASSQDACDRTAPPSNWNYLTCNSAFIVGWNVQK